MKNKATTRTTRQMPVEFLPLPMLVTLASALLVFLSFMLAGLYGALASMLAVGVLGAVAVRRYRGQRRRGSSRTQHRASARKS